MSEASESSGNTRKETPTSQPTSQQEWSDRFGDAAREKRDEDLCQACRLVAAKRTYPVVDRLGRQIGEEIRCDECQQKYVDDDRFRTRINLRFRDRMRYLCWEKLGSHTVKFPELNELITRLIAIYGGLDGAVAHAWVVIHSPDTNVIWQRRILMALTNMVRLREEMESHQAQQRRKAEDIGIWLTKVKPEEALEFLAPLMEELIDSRMDLIVEYLRGSGWTVIPPWKEEPASGVASRWDPPPGRTTNLTAEPPLRFREST